MKKKMKRYNEGDVVELESKTGRNENIGDDVRERAMKFVAEGEKATPKAAPKKAMDQITAAPKKTEDQITAAPKKTEDQITAAPKTKESSFKEGTSSFKETPSTFKKGTSSFKEGTSSFKKMASGGKVSSASSRADGCAVKGKTKGRMV